MICFSNKDSSASTTLKFSVFASFCISSSLFTRPKVSAIVSQCSTKNPTKATAAPIPELISATLIALPPFVAALPKFKSSPARPPVNLFNTLTTPEVLFNPLV